MECDSDHARIELKKSAFIEIRVPQNWYPFVRTVRGKNPFHVTQMTQDDFFLHIPYKQTCFRRMKNIFSAYIHI